MLRWALTALRETFTEQAADELAKQSALDYMGCMENIQHIDDLLGERFLQLNKAYGRLENLELDFPADHEDDAVTKWWNDKTIAMNEKYGWNKPR